MANGGNPNVKVLFINDYHYYFVVLVELVVNVMQMIVLVDLLMFVHLVIVSLIVLIVVFV